MTCVSIPSSLAAAAALIAEEGSLIVAPFGLGNTDRAFLAERRMVWAEGLPRWQVLLRTRRVYVACTAATLSYRLQFTCLTAGHASVWLWTYRGWCRVGFLRLIAGALMARSMEALRWLPERHPAIRIIHRARRIPVLRRLWWRALAPDPGGEASSGEAKSVKGCVFSDMLPLLIACVSGPPGPVHNNTVVHVNDGLASGGTERQIVNTLLGQQGEMCHPVFIGRDLFRVPGLDFHLPALLSSGIEATGLKCSAKSLATRLDRLPSEMADLLCRLPSRLLAEVLDLYDEFCRRRPIAVHAWQDANAVPAAIAGLMAAVPVLILSLRNLNPTHFDYHQPWMRSAYRGLATTRAIFVVNSEAGRASYAAWLDLDEARFGILRNGIQSGRRLVDVTSRRLARDKFGLLNDKPVVGGGFRFWPEKRPLLWLQAAAAIRKIGVDAHFIIAGTGPLMKEAEVEACRLGLTGCIHFLGEWRDMDTFYNALDVLLLVSSEEGTPNVLLEAQSVGVPVVACDAGGCREAVATGRSGIIIPVTASPEIIAESLIELLTVEWQESARQEGPAFVEELFSNDRMVRETTKLYRVCQTT